MKVQIARIRLYLKVGKKLSDGSSPIMLMCSFNNQRKEISTGYSCTIKYWDKRSECIKPSFGSNAHIINRHLRELKESIISKRDRYIANGDIYTPQILLAKDEDKSIMPNDFGGLIDRYIDEKCLESKTVEKWNIVRRSVLKFVGRDILITEIDEGFCRRYARWLESNGLCDGSIRSYLAKIGALCNYAIKNGLIDSYPFEDWKYHVQYRESKNELYIHYRSIEVMKEMFINECIETEGNSWRYREGVIEKLMDIHSELYSHYLYLATVHCCGLSPVDLSFLKKVDIKVVEIKGISCWAIDGNRSKTGNQYKIRLRKDDILSKLIIETMLMFHSGEYLLPTLEGYKGKDIKKRVNNLYTYHGDNLVEWFRRINEEIVKRNVANGDSIPLIDLDCRYYSARHSYIMGEIQKPNVNLLRLATVTGKSVVTLHQYISLLGELDLVD